MNASSQWFGPRSPVIPAKRYTSDSLTVLRKVTFLPTQRASNASLAAGPIVIPLRPAPAGSGPPAEQLAADDDALDLTGALPDRIEPGVAVQPLDGGLGRVPGRPVDLQRVVRDPDRRLRGDQLGLRRLADRQPALVGQPGGPADEPAGGLDGGRHVGQHELDRLEVDDRLSEGGPLPAVSQRLLHGRLREPHRLGADADPALVERAHGLLEPLPGRRQQRLRPDVTVLEDQLA